MLSHNATKVLSGLLRDKNGRVRSTAVKSLQSCPVDFALDLGIVKMIFKSLNDADGEVRENAVVTLGKLGPATLRIAGMENMEDSLKTPRKTNSKSKINAVINESPWFHKSKQERKRIELKNENLFGMSNTQ